MKTLIWIIFIQLLLMAHSLPALGAERECVEVWNDNISSRHVVDLDTGAISSYEYDWTFAQYLSPDRHHSLQYTGSGSTLTLIDLYTGTTHTISENAKDLVWSSDGLRFIYRYQSPQGEQTLLLYELASATERIISENVTMSPAQLSDDGQWLIYRQKGAAGKYNLVLYNIAEGTERVLTRDVVISSVGWSPDSIWLTRIQGESEQATRFELVLYNVLTSEEFVYSFDSPVSESSFAWSPDGLRIALAVRLDIVREYTEVYILSAPELDVIDSVNPTLSRVEMLWSPSGRSLILSAWDSADFALVDISVQPITMVQAQLGAYAPPYFLSPDENWSPDETYRIVYHSPGDLATGFTLLNRRGEVLVDEYVPSSLYDFETQHWWIDAHHFLLNEWDNGFHALILFDARTGERQTLFNPIAGFALSFDRELFALIPVTVSPSYQVRREVRFYAWTGEAFTFEQTVPTPDEPRAMVWRADRSELIVLFEDQILRAYSYEAETWRSVATLPDTNAWSIRPAPCSG